MIEQNNADVKSLKEVQGKKSAAYSKLKTKLSMTNANLMNFIKAKLVRNYRGADMALNLNSPEGKSEV